MLNTLYMLFNLTVHSVYLSKNRHMCTIQAKATTLVYSDIQAYLGSGVKKIYSVFFIFFLHHWPLSVI